MHIAVLYFSSHLGIDDRHRNPNIIIREIIWLGNQLPPDEVDQITGVTSDGPSRKTLPLDDWSNRSKEVLPSIAVERHDAAERPYVG